MPIEFPGAYSLSAPKPSAHHDHDASHDEMPNSVLGFWLYLMTDCIIFASLFAVYVVLAPNNAEGPTGKEIFELPYVLVETALLLLSSLTYGLAMAGVAQKSVASTFKWLIPTFLLGLGFIGMEINEFHHLISEGAGPSRSAFLSSFFTLVGTHGLHVASGLVWMAVMMVQIGRFGINSAVSRRMTCLSLFWHFLDIVWICVFTIVYLMGVL